MKKILSEEQNSDCHGQYMEQEVWGVMEVFYTLWWWVYKLLHVLQSF